MKEILSPQEMFRTYGVCIEQIPVIEHIWRNRNTKNFVSVCLNKLSKSKTVRQASFSIEYNGEKIHVRSPYYIAFKLKIERW